VRLNVVAVLYTWSLRRFARRRTSGPEEIESLLNRRRPMRPRLAVLDVLSGYVLEIAGGAAASALVLVLLGRLTSGRYPELERALHLLGATLAAFPLAMYLAVASWAVIPDRRAGGYFRHPERLWPPTIATAVLTVAAGFIVYAITPA
jgi:hypothetical protein